MAPVASRSSPPRRSARLAAKSQLELQQSSKAPSASLTPRARREPRTTKNLPPKPSSVCKFCWNGPIAAQYGLFHPPFKLDGERVHPGGGYSYFISKHRWEQGAASDCVWCIFVRQVFWQYKQYKGSGPGTDRMKITIGSWPDGMMCAEPGDGQCLRLFANDSQSSQHRIAYVCTSADDPAAEYVVMRDPILDVGSPRALSAAKAHLEECVHGHEHCSRLSPPSDVRLPTRLVDCTDPNRPRLVKTRGTSGKYFALSYVWGEAQPHKTTQANVSIYVTGIDASLLPQTIRDAIYVTHQLGFQYLWADSLCIVQDSDEDKLHEIGRMHLIYRRAHLTIIAARASRVSEGFLQDRPPGNWLGDWGIGSLPFLCPSRSPNSEEKSVGEVFVFQDLQPFEGLPTEPIEARGWCFQESCMSPRVLVFGKHIFHFRCHLGMRSVGNSFHDKSDNRLDSYQQLSAIVLNPDVVFPPKRGSEEWFYVHNHWLEIVERYSERSLGQSSDKLVACGAIAEAFHRVLRSDYLAGMWRDNLPCELLWRTYGARRPTEYRGPSWSWISVDGYCTTEECRNYSEQALSTIDWAKVARCEVILKDMGNPFGEVIGGFLVLNAPLIHCRVVGFTCGEDGYTRASLELLPTQRDQWPRVKWVVERAPGSSYTIDTSDDFPEPHSVTTWQLVPIEENLGLVVVPADPRSARTHTESGKVYRRIGAFDLWRWEARDGSLEDALQHDKVPSVEIEII